MEIKPKFIALILVLMLVGSVTGRAYAASPDIKSLKNSPALLVWKLNHSLPDTPGPTIKALHLTLSIPTPVIITAQRTLLCLFVIFLTDVEPAVEHDPPSIGATPFFTTLFRVIISCNAP